MATTKEVNVELNCAFYLDNPDLPTPDEVDCIGDPIAVAEEIEEM